MKKHKMMEKMAKWDGTGIQPCNKKWCCDECPLQNTNHHLPVLLGNAKAWLASWRERKERKAEKKAKKESESMCEGCTAGTAEGYNAYNKAYFEGYEKGKKDALYDRYRITSEQWAEAPEWATGGQIIISWIGKVDEIKLCDDELPLGEKQRRPE